MSLSDLHAAGVTDLDSYQAGVADEQERIIQLLWGNSKPIFKTLDGVQVWAVLISPKKLEALIRREK